MSYCSSIDEDKSNNFNTKNLNRLNSSDRYLINRNTEKNKLIETVFLMK